MLAAASPPRSLSLSLTLSLLLARPEIEDTASRDCVAAAAAIIYAAKKETSHTIFGEAVRIAGNIAVRSTHLFDDLSIHR